MAEVFFCAAWTAGIIEGGSILGHAKANENGASFSLPLLLVPSIFYGTAALPLGIIGASPGPLLVSKFPFAPNLAALESNGMALSLPQQHSTKDAPNNVTTESKQTTPSQQAPETPSKEDNDTKVQETPTIISRHDMIHKLREENRRALAAARQQQQQQNRPPVQKAIRIHHQRPASTTTKSSSRLLLSTLDGRPLATPLAEAMRRARYLCVGAGLVMTAITYEQSRRDQLEQEQVRQRHQQQIGRDANAIQSLIKNGNCQNGVALRLLREIESWSAVNKPKGVVVPLVHSSADTRTLSSVSGGSNDTVYWNLGNTPQDWKEMPLTKDWLLRDNQDDAAFLVLEVDVSSNSLSDYLMPGRPSGALTYTIESWENTMLVSRILDMIAQQKEVLANGSEKKNVTTVNVIVGSGPRPRELEDANTIYINGTAAVGQEVLSMLERAYPSPTEETETPETVPVENDSEASNEAALTDSDTTDDSVSLFEYVGMKLRQGGTHAASAVTRIFTRGTTKTVHVVSDSPLAAQWLQRIMPYGWLILGYSAFEDSEVYRSAIAEENSGIVFCCCENDEATCAAVCSLLTNDESKGASPPVVALVKQKEYANILRDLATEMNGDGELEVVSAVEIHNNMFDRARELLASGKTASEAQESLEMIE